VKSFEKASLQTREKENLNSPTNRKGKITVREECIRKGPYPGNRTARRSGREWTQKFAVGKTDRRFEGDRMACKREKRAVKVVSLEGGETKSVFSSVGGEKESKRVAP